jgi:hypothetical protein
MKNPNFYEDLKMTEPKKISIETFTVNYYKLDGTFARSEEVRPVPFMSKNGAGLKELIELQERIIKYVVWESFSIATMVCDPVGLDLLNKTAAMLAVVGRQERGIDLVQMLEVGDYNQIGSIFLDEHYGTSADGLHVFSKPSLISKIHRIDYWGKFRAEGTLKQTADLAKLTEPMIVPPQSPATINTPPPVADAGTSISSPMPSKPMDLVPLS